MLGLSISQRIKTQRLIDMLDKTLAHVRNTAVEQVSQLVARRSGHDRLARFSQRADAGSDVQIFAVNGTRIGQNLGAIYPYAPQNCVVVIATDSFKRCVPVKLKRAGCCTSRVWKFDQQTISPPLEN